MICKFCLLYGFVYDCYTISFLMVKGFVCPIHNIFSKQFRKVTFADKPKKRKCRKYFFTKGT